MPLPHWKALLLSLPASYDAGGLLLQYKKIMHPWRVHNFFILIRDIYCDTKGIATVSGVPSPEGFSSVMTIVKSPEGAAVSATEPV